MGGTVAVPTRSAIFIDECLNSIVIDHKSHAAPIATKI
jgi:hypothetical protein